MIYVTPYSKFLSNTNNLKNLSKFKSLLDEVTIGNLLRIVLFSLLIIYFYI